MVRALILIDLQNDFMPGGSLPVPAGTEVIAVANRELRRKGDRYDYVVATQDWHPRDHGSFAANHERTPGEVIDLHGLEQVLWPVHCVQDSSGAAFVDGLAIEKFDRVFRKGTDRTVDSYSGFFDNGRRHDTGLADWLRTQGVDEVYCLGVATDYCVKFTALDAASEGFATHLLRDGCRGVDLRPGDSERAIGEMEAAGVRIQ
ncbi:MAG: bifunctional nicotinamidase/pyrazinamidase [Myxococcota bacterium]